MNMKRNKSNVVKEPAANKLQVQGERQKSLQEELGLELNPGSDQLKKRQKSADPNQPVSERTAWN